MTAPPVRDWSTPREAGALFLRGRTVRTALPIAAVVGTLLSAVNQGVIITGGDADTTTWIRVAVNFVVPFCVASFGYLAARRRPAPGRAADPAAAAALPRGRWLRGDFAPRRSPTRPTRRVRSGSPRAKPGRGCDRAGGPDG